MWWASEPVEPSDVAAPHVQDDGGPQVRIKRRRVGGEEAEAADAEDAPPEVLERAARWMMARAVEARAGGGAAAARVAELEQQLRDAEARGAAAEARAQEAERGAARLRGESAALAECPLTELRSVAAQLHDSAQCVTQRIADREAAERECVVCRDAVKDTLLVPCGHLIACNACARNLRECPTCRARWRDDDDAVRLPAHVAAGAAAAAGVEALAEATPDEGFLNLGTLQPGTRAARDSSSYSEWLELHQRRREQAALAGGSPQPQPGARARTRRT